MALYVTLVVDLFDGSGQPYSGGQLQFTPSAVLTDVPDQQVVPPSAVTVSFASGPLPPSATLLASDSAGPQPAGWSWGVSSTIPGLPSWSFFAPAGPVAFTATDADPCVLTWAPGAQAWQLRSLPDGTGVRLSGGSLPGGFQAGATYYVTGSSGDTVQLAATLGGTPLGSLSAGSGELTVVRWHLSALAQVQATAAMGGYLGLPSGTAAAGLVPVATGSGTATAWALPDVQVDGGSAASVYTSDQVIDGGNA